MGLLRSSVEWGELATLHLLAQNGSTSAAILTESCHICPMIWEAFFRIREDQTAQVAVGNILAAKRFKCYRRGSLYPTRCPNGCGGEEGYGHLVMCCVLLGAVASVAGAVDFLVAMVRRSKGARPRDSAPLMPPTLTTVGGMNIPRIRSACARKRGMVGRSGWNIGDGVQLRTRKVAADSLYSWMREANSPPDLLCCARAKVPHVSFFFL